VVLEVVVDYEIWIFHAFYNTEGSQNDINMLQRSAVFARLVEGHAPPCNYDIIGHQYTKGYYLANDIYPRWSTVVKTASEPLGLKKSHFASRPEGWKNDVEREFGVLQTQFTTLLLVGLKRRCLR
jgi:hypothetical protein